jgi:thiol peroxidase
LYALDTLENGGVEEMKVNFKEKEVEVTGTPVEVGTQAPDFELPDMDNRTFRLSEHLNHPIILSVVPDITTSTCSLQTHWFNMRVGAMKDVNLVTISNNTPEQQKSWCSAEGVDMDFLHDTELTFANKYGVYMPDIDHLARSVFLIDTNGVIVYKEIVAQQTEEPNYSPLMQKLSEVLD